MKVLMVRAPMKEEHVAEAEAAVQKLIAALEESAPEGVRYASGKLVDGTTLVALLQLDEAGEHPLLGFPAYEELVESLEPWKAEAAKVEVMTVVGSYGLFG